MKINGKPVEIEGYANGCFAVMVDGYDVVNVTLVDLVAAKRAAVEAGETDPTPTVEEQYEAFAAVVRALEAAGVNTAHNPFMKVVTE